MIQKLDFEFNRFNSIQELPEPLQSLFTNAFQSRKKAYAPYSEFLVGCAILLENGIVVEGNNQENASYPAGICAERVAITHCGANFPDIKIKAIAIVAGKDMNNDNPIAPCGICRQTILEFENKQNSPIEIYFMGTTGSIVKSSSAKNLLPFSFSKEALG